MTTIVDEGPRDAVPVVLVHGVGLDHHMWDAVAGRLGADHRVVRYDLAGHGTSAALPDGSGLDVFTAQLGAVADRAGLDTFVLVGFSLGALIAQRFAIEAPERLIGLILANGVFDRTAAEREAVVARVADVRAGGYAASVETALDRWFTPMFAASHPDAVATVRDRLHRNNVTSYANAYHVFATADADLASAAASITVPTLVFTGADDARSTPAMTTALAAAIPGAQAVVLPGLRHLAPVEGAARVADLIAAFVHEMENA